MNTAQGKEEKIGIFNAPLRQAEPSKSKLQDSGKFKAPIVSEVVAVEEFYPAEEYHQKYFQKHGIKPACHAPFR